MTQTPTLRNLGSVGDFEEGTLVLFIGFYPCLLSIRYQGFLGVRTPFASLQRNPGSRLLIFDSGNPGKLIKTEREELGFCLSRPRISVTRRFLSPSQRDSGSTKGVQITVPGSDIPDPKGGVRGGVGPDPRE